MSTATMKPASGAGGRHAQGRGYGLIFFAAILMFVDGFFNMLYGIAAIANSHVFVAGVHYVVGDLRAWAGSRSSSPSCSWSPGAGAGRQRWPAGSRWPYSGSVPSK